MMTVFRPALVVKLVTATSGSNNYERQTAGSFAAHITGTGTGSSAPRATDQMLYFLSRKNAMSELGEIELEALRMQEIYFWLQRMKEEDYLQVTASGITNAANADSDEGDRPPDLQGLLYNLNNNIMPKL